MRSCNMMYRSCATLMMAVLACASANAQNGVPALTDLPIQYEEWSAETRTSLSFRVNADAVRTLLPQGWTVAANTSEPEQTGLTVTFMDRHVVLDSQRQPVGTGSSRYMVMSVQARNENTGQSGPMIINGISPEGAGAYEVYQQAVDARAERFLTGQGEQSSSVQENWQMASGSGDSISFTLSYQQAVPVRQQSTIVIRSGKNTGFTRTYKIDQTNDPLGVPGAPDSRIESVSFRAQGPLYSRLFDGSEVLTGITSTPWYNREIFIP